MKWIHKVSPKILLICVSAVALLSLTAGSALAYLKTNTQQADNQFTPGVIDIQIVEPSTDYKVLSDNSVNKEVQVENVRHEHSAPAYVRVKLVPIMRWDNGSGSGDAVADSIKYDVNKTDWVEGTNHDGFYYYKHVLNPGDVSKMLITKVILKDKNVIPNGKKLEIQVIADSVQVSDEATKSAWNVLFDSGAWKNP